MKQQASLRHKVADICDRAVLFGGLGMLGGLSLMLTVFLSGAGVFLALGGGVTMVLGLTGKLTASLWSKTRSRATGG